MNRRQFLTQIVPAAAAAPLALAAGAEAAPELPLSEIAWSRVSEADRSVWYFGQGWKAADVALAHPRREAEALRWALGKLYHYPLVSYPALPIHLARQAALEANQRAALVTLIEGLSGPDLAAVYSVAATLEMHPLTEAGRAKLGRAQRRRFEPGGGEW